MDNFSVIAEGWGNYLFPSKEIKEMAISRAKICATCTHLEDTMIAVPDANSQIAGKKCGLCKCPLSAATRSPQKHCPIHKW